jgi:hypothetical protein
MDLGFRELWFLAAINGKLEVVYKMVQTVEICEKPFFFFIFFRLQVSSLELEYEVGG